MNERERVSGREPRVTSGLERLPRSWWLRAAAAGALGGLAMGLYLLVAMQLDGPGAWYPFNIIGATLPMFRPPSTTIDVSPVFLAGPSLTGIVLHLLVATIWGLGFGVMVAAFAARRARSFAWETLYGLAWASLGWFLIGRVATALNPLLYLMMLSAHFFIGHLVYGVVTGWTLAALTRPRELMVTFAPEETRVRR